MYSPKQTLFWMFLYLAAVGAVCTLLFEPLYAAFEANRAFNSLILGVLSLGILIVIRQVVILGPEVKWIEMFRTGQMGLSLTREPRLLKPLAINLAGRVKDRFSMSALSLRTVLDGIRSRLDESREISHYLTGLLVFLGLLGTFWGLIGTVGAVGKLIGGLDPGSGDFATVFGHLKAGLQEPLAGMGTAFSSSFFGLGGSLILGFLDLLAGHAQNRFYDSLEEWLSGLTNLIDGPSAMAADALAPEEPDWRYELTLLLNEVRAQRPRGPGGKERPDGMEGKE